MDFLDLLTLAHLVHFLSLEQDILHRGLLHASTIRSQDAISTLRWGGCRSHNLDRHSSLVGHLLDRHARLGQRLSDRLRYLLGCDLRDLGRSILLRGASWGRRWSSFTIENLAFAKGWTVGRRTAVRRGQVSQLQLVFRRLWDLNILRAFLSLAPCPLLRIDSLVKGAFLVNLFHLLVRLELLVLVRDSRRVLIQISSLICLVFSQLVLLFHKVVPLVELGALEHDSGSIVPFILRSANHKWQLDHG